MFFCLLLAKVHSFEYLSAIVHSQDVSPISHRELWHPHLYLAKDSSGDNYEIRHSYEYYDVSISFLQTSSEETAPGVMNCECRFVKEEVEEEEETTFLQVMTPSKVKPKIEQKDKEISIGAFVPKQKEFEYSPQVNDFQHENNLQMGKTVVRQENFREEYLNEGYKAPEIIVIQGYPDMKGIQNQGFNQGSYQSGYQNNGFGQNNFGYQGNGFSGTTVGYNQGNNNQPGFVASYAPGYNSGYNQGYSNQPVYTQSNPQGQGFVQGYQNGQQYVQGQNVQQGFSQGQNAQQGFSQGQNVQQGFSQGQEHIQTGYYSQYVPQNNYVQQPVIVSGYNQPQYVQEYPNQMQQVPQITQVPQVIQVPQVNYQQGFLQTKY